MKIAHLQKSRNSFLDKLSFLLNRNGFKNISISYTDGVLSAEKRVHWFAKRAKLLISISDLDEGKGMEIEIIVNDMVQRYDTATNVYEKLEESILDIIYTNF